MTRSAARSRGTHRQAAPEAVEGRRYRRDLALLGLLFVITVILVVLAFRHV